MKMKKNRAAKRLAKLTSLSNLTKSHVLGEHGICDERGYFCKEPKGSEVNLLQSMKDCEIYQEIMRAVNYFADNSKRFIDSGNQQSCGTL